MFLGLVETYVVHSFVDIFMIHTTAIAYFLAKKDEYAWVNCYDIAILIRLLRNARYVNARSVMYDPMGLVLPLQLNQAANPLLTSGYYEYLRSWDTGSFMLN